MMTATTSITSRQSKKFKQLFEDAADRTLDQVTKDNTDKDNFQKALESGDLQDALVKAALEVVNKYANGTVAQTVSLPVPSSSNQYANEETASKYGYPKKFRYRSIEEQVAFWTKQYPDMDATHVTALASVPLPDGAESYVVMPKPSKLGATYHDALETVLGLIAASRSFKNWREGELGKNRLRLTEKTWQSLKKLESETSGDFLVIPVQFGKRHIGRSVRRARACFADNEFGLSPYEVACMLLTHTDRISGTDEESWIFCAGVEYAPGADGDFSCSMCFHWGDGRLGFGRCDVAYVFVFFGSASALVPLAASAS
jgi:hypothetical protein